MCKYQRPSYPSQLCIPVTRHFFLTFLVSLAAYVELNRTFIVQVAIGLFPPMFSCRPLRSVPCGLTSFALWINAVGITVTKLLASGAPQLQSARRGRC